MSIQVFENFNAIAKSAWDPLIQEDFPFLEYAFLHALEKSGSVGESTGWNPQWITYWNDGELWAAIPLYEKTNSYGEYIFDWQWANAFYHHGIEYYPKWTSAIPFTPATQPKLLVHPKVQDRREEILNAMFHYLKEASDLRPDLSSIHFLFILPKERDLFERNHYSIRYSHQYHWKNHDYRHFDDFLNHLKRKERQHIRRERRQIDPDLEIFRVTGKDITEEHLDAMIRCYHQTTLKMGAIAYLNPEFFRLVFESMADHILITGARRDGVIVAQTLNFFKGKHLYGRYWGCLEENRHLHFELCYYQTIEFAIQQGLQLFEAGAQGEHKIQRGFVPEITLSAHLILDTRFAEAIVEFIGREREAVEAGVLGFRENWPFREV